MSQTYSAKELNGHVNWINFDYILLTLTTGIRYNVTLKTANII